MLGVYLGLPRPARCNLPEIRDSRTARHKATTLPDRRKLNFKWYYARQCCAYFTVSSVIDHFVSIVMACALRGSLLVDSESDPSSSDCS